MSLKLRQNVLFNKRGFSIIEALIALGISGIAMYAVMSIADLSMRSGQLANRQTAFTELSREVRMILDNPNTCGNFLRDTADPTQDVIYPTAQADVNVGSIFMGASAVATTGAKLEGSDMNISSIVIHRDLTVPVDTFNVGGTVYLRYYVNLNVTASIGANATVALGGKRTYSMKFPFVAVVNQGTTRLETCQGTQNSAVFYAALSDLSLYYSPLAAFGNVCTYGDPNFIQDTNIACNRWCAGCGPILGSLCTGVFPGRGFNSGVATLECSMTIPNSAACLCLR